MQYELGIVCGDNHVYYKFKSDELVYDSWKTKSWCFGKISYSGTLKIHHNIEFSTRFALNDKYSKANCHNRCYLTQQQISLWLEELKQIVPFDYSIEFDTTNQEGVISLTSKILSRNQLFWLLIGVRNCFEGRYAIVLKECFDLIEKEYVNASLTDLYPIIHYSLNCENYHSWYCGAVDLLKLSGIKTTLEDKKPKNINSSFDYLTIQIKRKRDDFCIALNEKHLKYRYDNLYLPVLKQYKETKNLPDNFTFIENELS